MQQCKICGSKLPLDASMCGMCGHPLSNSAEEITLISNADLSANDSLSATLISGDAPTFISGSARMPQTNDALGPLENTHVLTLLANGDDQPTLLLADSEDTEDDEERKRRVLPGVPLAGLMERGTQQAGQVPTVQGTPSLTGVPEVQGTAPMAGGTPAGNAATPEAPAGSAPSRIEPGRGARTTLSHSTPTDHLEHEHHEREHHHERGHRHESAHRRGREHHHERGHHRLAHRRGCTITLLVTIVAGVIIFSLIISGWFFSGHPRLTLTGDGHVTWGDDLHVHGSGFPGGASITLEIDDGRLYSNVNRSGGVQSNAVASANSFADVLFSRGQQTGSSNGTLTVHDDGTFDATIHIGQNWHLGRHLIHAIEKGSSVEVDLAFFIDTQPSPARLSVNSLAADFGKVIAGSKPVRSVTLSNTGDQRLVWTADAGGVTWLKLASGSGSIGAGDPSQALQLMADTSSLSAGMHQALLHIQSNGGNAQVNVSLLVVASTTPVASKSAHLTVNTAKLDFGQVGAGSTVSKSITLGNDGQGALNWTASTDGSGWWGIDNPGASIQPGGSSSLTATIKTGGLSSGTYLGTLTISSNGGAMTVSITVTITASPSPAHLTASSTSINFGSVQQGNAAQQSISIGNNGGQALQWSATTNGASWWGIDTTNGVVQPGGSQSLTLSVKSGGLNPGKYSGTLTISSNGGTVSIPISLTVTAQPQPPCITVDQNSVALSVKQGQTTGQNVVFTNCGQVAGNVSIVANAANGSGWLSIAELSGGPIGGTYAPGASQTISINLDATNLPPGKYSGTVTATITTSANLSQSVTVNVTFTVL